jgi:preprotein translocase subunit SecA
VSFEGGIQGLGRLIGRPSGNNNNALIPYQEKLAAVNGLEAVLGTASDDDLREQARIVRQRVTAETPAGSTKLELFALVREVARREIGLRPDDVQIIGGLGLHESKIVQMETGEG